MALCQASALGLRSRAKQVALSKGFSPSVPPVRKVRGLRCSFVRCTGRCTVRCVLDVSLTTAVKQRGCTCCRELGLEAHRARTRCCWHPDPIVSCFLIWCYFGEVCAECRLRQDLRTMQFPNAPAGQQPGAFPGQVPNRSAAAVCCADLCCRAAFARRPSSAHA